MVRAVSTVMADGRVTIPAQVRDAAGWDPGDRIEWQSDASGSVLVRRFHEFPDGSVPDWDDLFWEWSSPDDEVAFRDL